MGNKSSKKSKSKTSKKGGGGTQSKSGTKAAQQSSNNESAKDASSSASSASSSTPTPNSGGGNAAAASSSSGGGGKNSGGAASSSSSSSSSGDDNSDASWGDEPTLLSRTGQKVTTEDFELLTVIGKGSFGKVMQVRKKDDGKIYAMKVLRKEAIIARKQVAHTRAEKAILQKIQHPFIVNLNFAFQTEDKLYMILDYINGGELFFHLKKEGNFSEDRVRIYAAEIVLALAHLHSFDIVYRDLKPESMHSQKKENEKEEEERRRRRSEEAPTNNVLCFFVSLFF
jgi:serum/glucocorticoid-regulated kinase 2